jgi:DnaJ-domain-containing protein 1
MTERPLLRSTIVELEELFRASSSDIAAMQTLESELTHRQVPRAVALLAQVRRVLNGKNVPEAAATKPLPAQPGLFAEVPSDTPKVQAAPKDNLKPEPAAKAGLPAMTVEEAYKILRVTAATSWSDIEQARRQLVQKAHPDNLSLLSSEKREATRALARLANAAYHVLHRSKLS